MVGWRQGQFAEPAQVRNQPLALGPVQDVVEASLLVGGVKASQEAGPLALVGGGSVQGDPAEALQRLARAGQLARQDDETQPLAGRAAVERLGLFVEVLPQRGLLR